MDNQLSNNLKNKYVENVKQANKQTESTAQQNKIKPSKTKQYKCKSCGGNLVYCPNNQDLICEKCLSHEAIQFSKNVKKHLLNEELSSKNSPSLQNENKSIKCPNCGSEIELKAYEISKTCDYCGSSVIAQATNVIAKKPDGIIPFMFDKEVASEKFVAGVKKQWLAPKQFKKKPPQSIIEGDYIPSFGFNADAVYTYRGVLYENVTVRDSEGHNTTERRYFNISGADSNRYENILVEASSKIKQDNINNILPFKYKDCFAYNDAFIAGYVVEKYDTEVENCLQKYNKLLDENITADILSKYRYDGVRSLNFNKTVSNESFSYYVVPVYKFSYTYKDKQYITYMNGQTGRIDSNIPKSRLKQTLLVLLPFIFVLLFIILGFFAGK